DPKESQFLDLVDGHQYLFHPFVSYQRLYPNFMVLFYPAHPGRDGMDRMEKKSK
ncbi:MAG: hypothetical protein RL282_1935, partial [Bacteroidota bacterium]